MCTVTEYDGGVLMIDCPPDQFDLLDLLLGDV